jgi:hypothetical protein
MKAPIAAALTALAAVAAVSLPSRPAAGAAPSPAGACLPSGKLNFICGLNGVEDLVAVPDGPWIVGSAFTLGSSAARPSPALYLINTRTRTARPMTLLPGPAPRRGPFAGCAPPDLKTLNTHGLDLRPGLGDVHTLYAVNHAGRESIEVFRLDARSASPTAIWTGCLLMPKGAAANSVAALPRGRIAVTKFQSARAPDAIVAILNGALSGSVYVWTPGAGFKELAGSQLAGNNGLTASADGRWLFVNAYGGKAVHRFALDGSAPPRKTAVDIRPDNIRWGPDGKLLVTGQFITPETLDKPHGWAVLRLDPQTMAVSVVMKEPPRPVFDDATTAIPAAGQLWIGTFRGDRIAYAPLK